MKSGCKTWDFDAIRNELHALFDVHDEMGSHPGGVHLEMTGKGLTKCMGGDVGRVDKEDLGDCYHTHCDPCLYRNQALGFIFLIAETVRERTGLPAIE